MRGMPLELHPGKGGLDFDLVAAALGGFVGGGGKWKRSDPGFVVEPCSVLDRRRSPSPPTSTSTLSSSLGGGSPAGVAAVSDTNVNFTSTTAPGNRWSPSPSSGERREDWDADLQPINPSLDMEMVAADKRLDLGVDDWDSMLGDPAASPGNDHTFLRWIMGDVDDSKNQHQQPFAPASVADLDSGASFGTSDHSGFGFDPLSVTGAALPSLPAANFYFPPVGGLPFSMKFASVCNSQGTSSPVLFPPPAAPVSNIVTVQPGVYFSETHPSQNPSFFLPIQDHVFPQVKNHQVDPSGQIPNKVLSPGGGAATQELFLRRNQAPTQAQPQPVPYHLQHGSMKPKAGAEESMAMAAQQQQQQQALVDQLFKVGELVEAGNSVSARGILARLNHQLPSPVGKPLLRSAFYIKDALQFLLNFSNSHPTPLPCKPPAAPLDVVLKLSTYKTFSEVSPVLQFINFTCIQALLEEVGNASNIHIVDFDIGVGGQWSSFMQELAHRRCTAAANPSPLFLKITAFLPPSSHHPLELLLTRDNLTHFAADLNIPFEFNALPLHSFDAASVLALSSGEDSIAVNLPVCSMVAMPAPSILRLIKQLSPKIVISVDQGADRSDLPFSHHILHLLQSSMVLLDSIDAACAVPDVAQKIERYLLQPRIEAALMSSHRAGEKMIPWRTLFASLGFAALQFSNFTETQAECVVKRVQVRGFHVDKRQTSLVLYWQRGELASVSAWQ